MCVALGGREAAAAEQHAPPQDPEPRRGAPPGRRVVRGVATVLVAGLTGAAVAGVVAHRPQTVVVERYEPNAAPVAGARLDIQAILFKVEPAVVAIDVTRPTSAPAGAVQASGGATFTTDHGSGMIVSPDGRVLTNHHVIAAASTIRVWVHGMRAALAATVVHDDAVADLAVLQVSGASHLATVAFGNSTQARVGDRVVAIGDALDLGRDPTVTTGIISAVGRSVPLPDPTGSWTFPILSGLLQTDAPLNPGDSGAPLVDSSGQVIGMNTIIASGTGTGTLAHDIGFAIASNDLRAFAERRDASAGPNISSAHLRARTTSTVGASQP